MSEPKPQQISAKIAESKRPFHGQAVLKNPEVRERFAERAQIILDDLKELESLDISLSPFIEIGAGSVHRSAALINNYPADGVATDISQKSLQDTPFVIEMLGYEKQPMLISCDAHHIPFLPNTFQFIFAYQTLHHFENPIPVLAECHRVLAKDGHLFFNEEPLDSSIRRVLRGNRELQHPPTKIQAMATKLGVEKVFWDDGALERSLGMTEARFDLDLWLAALKPFKILDIVVNKKLKIRSDFETPRINTLLSKLIGGNVRGLCKKLDGEPSTTHFRDRLMCLDCKSTQLVSTDTHGLQCSNCNRQYPVTEKEGIIRMLPLALEKELYPVSEG